jgi:hypothetical protein
VNVYGGVYITIPWRTARYADDETMTIDDFFPLPGERVVTLAEILTLKTSVFTVGTVRTGLTGSMLIN